MTTRVRFAFGNARVRALKSGLLGPRDVRTPTAFAPERRFDRLIEIHDKVRRSMPGCTEISRAVLGLHEIENLKLIWRVVGLERHGTPWRRAWRPLGRLATIPADGWNDVTVLAALAGRLRRTPYGPPVDAALRTHAGDLLAAELSFDRWASARLVAAADRLPFGEVAARRLVLMLVRERDLDALRRGVATYGLPADLAGGLTTLVRRELSDAALKSLAESLQRDDTAVELPRPIAPRPARFVHWAAARLALRRERRAACRRAFLGDPFCLAPAVALLLLADEEVRALAALAEAHGLPQYEPDLEPILAAGAMGR